MHRQKHLLSFFSAILICLLFSFLKTNGQSKKSNLKAVLISTFGNKNVYKTKSPLLVKKIYNSSLHNPTADIRNFVIIPNTIPGVQRVENTTIASTDVGGTVTNSSVTTTTTIPPGQVTKTSTGAIKNPPDSFVGTTSSQTTVTLSVPSDLSTSNFIRYIVVNEDTEFKYIKVLPGCKFTGTSPADTVIELGSPGADNPSKYILQVSKKDLNFNTYYLANSVILGKLLTIPLKVRKDYWDNRNTSIQGNLNVGYTFGWKHKLGNNPYQTAYLNVIFWGAGISQQKYFKVAGKYQSTGLDSLSAKTDEFAITYLNFGLAFEWEKFNLGIFWGKDKMFGNQKDWVYQDKWWLGIGIGYELFK